MSKIRIQNFGPIKDSGWINISKVTLFIGNQGSGKSTVAKLISVFSWIEKVLVRKDKNYSPKWFQYKNRLRNKLLPYHRLEGFLDSFGKTSIMYKGETYSIEYNDDYLKFSENTDNRLYALPQVMYVPAERNFISYVRNPKDLKLSSDSLKDFLTEFENAKQSRYLFPFLPINGVAIEYNRLNDIIYIKGDGYKTKLTDAASGYQSIVPLYIVSDYLSASIKDVGIKDERMSYEDEEWLKKMAKDILSDKTLTEEQRSLAFKFLLRKIDNDCFINIVEEPEQNLFPSSQWELLKKLLEFNNRTEENKLIMTSHSPYIVNFLSLAIQGAYLLGKIGKKQGLLSRVEEVVPRMSCISGNDVSIYQLDETKGVIKLLEDYEGIPSDNNYLNQHLGLGNDLFDKLLEIEQEL